MTDRMPVISVRDLVVGFGEATVLDHASIDVFDGEILGFVGGSGAGKSVLMRAIIGLLPKRQGTVQVFGSDLAALGARERRAIEQRWGVLFQQGALFLAHRAAERAISHAGIPAAVVAADGRDRAGETRNGRVARRCA
jgi:phospholipid/cholesterol/gamma-HCH transport system ATP-binding protein